MSGLEKRQGATGEESISLFISEKYGYGRKGKERGGTGDIE